MKELTYLSDALFKYSFGKNNIVSNTLRSFLLKEVMGFEPLDMSVINPELIPEMIKQKNVILDTLLENDNLRIGIDMQATSFNIHLYKRFQQYLARLCSEQLLVGNDYASIKPAVMILFIKDMDKSIPTLVVEMKMINEEYNIPLPYPLQKLIIIQMPYIFDIVKRKDVLTEFEAMIYLMIKGNLEGIKYEENEGIINYMKERRRSFMTTGLYGAALEREYFTIDYDLMLKETKEESVKQGIEEGLEKGIEKGIEKGVDKGKMVILQKQLKRKYGDKCLWIHECTREQIDMISELIIDDISLEELKEKVFK